MAVTAGRIREALLISEDALRSAQAIGNAGYEAYALRYLSEIHESLGDFESALDCFKQFFKVQSRLDEEKVRTRARIAEVHYQTDRFKAIADQASRRAEALAAMNAVDPLTGVGNRRALDEILSVLAASSLPYGLAIIDLDHFKHINDTFTHAVGDEVLRRVGAILKTFIGPGDSAIRMGGEEFVIVLVDISPDAAIATCARLRNSIRSAPWFELDQTLRVTASIGVAAGFEAADPLKVLALADKRLYAAKHAGRDRVVGDVHHAIDGKAA